MFVKTKNKLNISVKISILSRKVFQIEFNYLFTRNY